MELIGVEQGVALTGRNTTGPPSRAAPWWVTLHTRVLAYRRRQTPATVASLAVCPGPTLCVGGPSFHVGETVVTMKRRDSIAPTSESLLTHYCQFAVGHDTASHDCMDYRHTDSLESLISMQPSCNSLLSYRRDKKPTGY